MEGPTISVIVITRNRPGLLKQCVELLLEQDCNNLELIVVDSSDPRAVNESSQEGRVTLVPLYGAINQMPRARNEGILRARGEIIAFVDDDSLVQTGWLNALIAPYSDPNVGGVGGMVLAPGEAPVPSGQVGVITGTGNLLGNFNVNASNAIEAEHLRGCNMSFRREALDAVGMFDEAYDVSNVREETDMCVRIRQAGWKLIYAPDARVIHLYARKEQFSRDERADLAYRYSVAKNTTLFRLRNFFSARTVFAALVAGPLLNLAKEVRRDGLRGVAASLNDWAGRIAGAKTYIRRNGR